MPEQQNRIVETVVGEDGNRQRFHVGNSPQIALPPEMTPLEEASLEAHKQSIKVPGPRPPFGVDEEGNPRPDPSLAQPEAAPAERPRGEAAPAAERKPPTASSSSSSNR